MQLRKILVSQLQIVRKQRPQPLLPREQCRDTADGLIPSRSAHCLQDNPSTSIIHSTSYCRGVSCSRMARKKAVRNALPEAAVVFREQTEILPVDISVSLYCSDSATVRMRVTFFTVVVVVLHQEYGLAAFVDQRLQEFRALR